MKAIPIDQLALLPEEEAVQRFFDAINWRTLRWILGAAFVVVLALGGAFLNRALLAHQTVLFLAHFALATCMVFLRNRPWYQRNFRSILISYILTEFLIGIAMFFNYPLVPLISLLFFPPMMLFLRLRMREYVLIGTVFLLPNIVAAVLFTDDIAGVIFGGIVGPFFVQAAYAAAGNAFSNSERRRFLTDWSAFAAREVERQRMRQELDVARKIQLAMLPDAPPAVDWIEIASMSNPATEVGGDFFEYYVLDDKRIAIVVGDVAGHGVSSGLVLAAVKSGLYLLRNDLADPAKAIAAINDMVRRSIRWRMLVSLLITIVDRSEGRVSVITAGHPPLLLRSAATGAVQRIGASSLPLGTNLPVTYTSIEAAIAPGDIMLLMTDGITEADRDGEMYGEERAAELLAAASGVGMRKLVDSLVGDVAAFTNGGVQNDDMTIVAARLR
jgi:hypothetical protein